VWHFDDLFTVSSLLVQQVDKSLLLGSGSNDGLDSVLAGGGADELEVVVDFL